MSNSNIKNISKGIQRLGIDELRTYRLIVRLNKLERNILDKARGNLSRAEAVRLSAFSTFPRPIPAINQSAWFDLSKTCGNLNQLLKQINTAKTDDINLVSDALSLVKDLRSKLLNIDGQFDDAIDVAVGE